MRMLSREELMAALEYQPETGRFVWRIAAGCRAPAGAVAGSRFPNGYMRIRFKGREYIQHRLAWFFMTGEWPTEVDHIDGDPSNNRWANLRLATTSQNACNRRGRSAGPKGVMRQHNGRYRAQIKKDGKSYHLGVYDTPEAAHRAYAEAAASLHGEFARVA